MKKRAFLPIFLLLAAILLLSACGESGAADEVPAETPAPETETGAVIEIPDRFIGTWVSVNDPGDTLVFGGDGTLSVNGTQIELVGSSDDSVRYRYADKEASISFLSGYLSGGGPLPLSDKSAHAVFYMQGTDNPKERFVGTWTLCAGEGSVWNDGAVEEFSITPEGELLLCGEAFPAVFEMVFDSREEYDWTLQTDDGRIWCSFFNDDPEALSLGTGEGWGRYYRDVLTEELTLKNWNDFFELLITYSLRRDEGGGVHNSMARAFLAGKEEIEILCVRDGKASVTSTPTTFAMIEYDPDTGEYTLRSIAPKERWKYNSKYFADYRNRTTEEPIREFGLEVSADEDPGAFRGWGVNFMIYSEDKPKIEEDLIIAPTVTKLVYRVNRISGTILYREKTEAFDNHAEG